MTSLKPFQCNSNIAAQFEFKLESNFTKTFCTIPIRFCSIFSIIVKHRFWIFFGSGNVPKKSTFSDLFWNCSWIQNFWQSTFNITTFPVVPCLDLLLVIKHYFNSAQGNFKNRPSHQLTVYPNRAECHF